MADANTNLGAPAAATFDFRGLVERARSDNPDAALLDALETDQEIAQRLKRARGEDQFRRVALEGAASMQRIAETRAGTVVGVLARLRHAERNLRGRRVCMVEHAAILDAIAFLEPPKPKRRRPAGKRKGVA